MPLSRIFRKASNFILRNQPEDVAATPTYSDGEVVFCKNNVCVHPPALIRQETDILHHPGYLTVTCQVVDQKRTLYLSWIPNTTLRKHPSTVEQRSVSVTRVQDVEVKDKNRRLSASSITLSNQSRRSSYAGSYECSGCFPENHSSELCLSLSPQLQLKNSDRRTYPSLSLSSNSDNTLTRSVNVKELTKGDEKECNNVQSGNSVDAESLDKDGTFNTERDLPSTEPLTIRDDTYRNNSNQSSNLETSNTVVSKPKIIQSSSSTDQNNDVPNDHCTANLTTELDTQRIELERNSNNQVPNNSSPNNDINSNIRDSSNVVDATKTDDSTGGECVLENYKQVRNDSISQKANNVQYTFSRPDGILYIDSLVLQENPHILPVPTNGFSSSSKVINEGCECSAVNCKLVNDCRLHNCVSDECVNNEVDDNVKKINNDNATKDIKIAPKSLPFRSYEGNYAPSWMSSPELLALKHNLTFPESSTASPVVRRSQRCCRKFCVDLSEMRSLRLFFSDTESTKGQLVIASRECQYKILHFHHSGLERLATLLQQWHLLTVVPQCDNLPYRHFMVCRPAVHDNELHPEEGKVGLVTMAEWLDMLNSLGQVEDDIALRKGIFLGGLDPSLRKVVWPFLLHCFSYQSTSAEREQILTIRRQEYAQITNRRLSLEGAAKERFIRNIQCIVEKDVIRTDRGNPYYAGESNPHLDVMKNILLNYAIYDSGLGYLQGMSDLLAPLLAEIGTEADTFWCFVGLMRRTIFVCTPTDSDMERNLNYLRELIREMVPEFYKHLHRHTDAMELLFCHRWILLCFKREFPEEMALKMWEACWANYLTDYFNLFLCLAIVSAYADDVIAQDLRTDEMLLHFSSLAMFMDGELILRKARGLLYQFRQRPVIPCTLAGLCRQCGPGMWDSGHAPTVECCGPDHCQQNPCLYRGTS